MCDSKEANEHVPETFRVHRGLIAAILVLIFFSGSYWLNTRSIDFPYGFHPDEAGKVTQLLSPDEYRNFNHPQLLLESTSVAMKWTETPGNEVSVVRLGRRVSAAFAALTVVAAALIGYSVGGLSGMVIVAVCVSLCPPLIMNAHYLKEDTGLIMGFMLVLLAARSLCITTGVLRSAVLAALLGSACAIAVSAKYIGAMAVPVSVALLFLGRTSTTGWRSRMMRLCAFAVAFGILVLAINYRAIGNWGQMRGRLTAEFGHAINGRRDVTMDHPNMFFVRTVLRETFPHLVIFAAAYVVLVMMRNRVAWEASLLSLTGMYWVGICFSGNPFHRYALPVVVLMHLTASLAVVHFLQMLQQSKHRYAGFVALTAILLIVLQLPRCLAFNRQFADDSRLRLRYWVAEHLSLQAGIAGDLYAGLRAPLDPHEPELIPLNARVLAEDFFVADTSESPAALAKLNVSHVVVCQTAYSRIMDSSIRAIPGFESDLLRRRDWYSDLFSHYRLVWISQPSHETDSYANPELRVYELQSNAARVHGNVPGKP